MSLATFELPLLYNSSGLTGAIACGTGAHAARHFRGLRGLWPFWLDKLVDSGVQLLYLHAVVGYSRLDSLSRLAARSRALSSVRCQSVEHVRSESNIHDKLETTAIFVWRELIRHC